MDFVLNEDQRAIEHAARRFAAEHLAPNAGEWDATEHFPVDVLREAAALGFASIYVKSDVGGCEMGRLDAVIIFEELSAGCTSTAALFSIDNMASWMIDRFGTDEQRKRFLPKMTTMEHIASCCLTEPGAGATTPLGAEAMQLYSLFAAKGHAGVDFSGIIKMLRGEP